MAMPASLAPLPPAPLPLPGEHQGPSWEVASDLPGRIRIRSRSLIDSPLLRQHCLLVLGSCHWLGHVRINGLAGSVCIAYPRHRRRDLSTVLAEALTLASVNDGLGLQGPRPFSAPRVRRTLAHGLGCMALLSLEGVVAIPSVAMGLVTVSLLWPLLREVVQQWRRRQLTVESLELSFSAVLVSQGLAAEALLDLAINDATEIAQSAVEAEDLELDSDQLLQRLGAGVNLTTLSAAGELRQLPLREVEVGMPILLNATQHCFLSARIERGELTVVNRLVDGDWRPRRLSRGDVLEPGALVIAGQAEGRILTCMRSDPAYALLHGRSGSLELERSAVEAWLSRYKRVMPPLLLSLGGLFLAQGSVERSLAAFQFNPVSDWENSSLASELTAIADLQLHRLRIRRPDALSSIGKIRHLVLSRSCLDRIGGIRLREQHQNTGTAPHGFLVQLLAGVQRWICGVEGTPIWSEQLLKVADPVAIRHVQIGNLLEGWQIEAEDGRRWRLIEEPQAAGLARQSHLDPLQIWQGDTLVGKVDVLIEPDRHWIEACEALRSMGITIHLVSSEPQQRLSDVAEPLGIAPAQVHGCFDASQRLDLVQQLQQHGQGVGFVGYVLHDLPALAQADVSIGLDVDDDSRYLSRICDLSLGSDALWLPRMIRISQALQRARTQNFGLLGGSQLLSSLATAAGLISPLQTVLLADIPLLLAELNNIWALQAPQQTPRTRTPLPPDPNSPADGGAGGAAAGS
jgi:hypothetical protein